MLLLDLQMPGLGGLDVIRRVRPGAHMPVIVIVTAYDEHALRAFEAGGIDYLLKPVAPARLAEAIARARLISGKPGAEKMARPQESRDRRRRGSAKDCWEGRTGVFPAEFGGDPGISSGGRSGVDRNRAA